MISNIDRISSEHYSKLLEQLGTSLKAGLDRIAACFRHYLNYFSLNQTSNNLDTRSVTDRTTTASSTSDSDTSDLETPAVGILQVLTDLKQASALEQTIQNEFALESLQHQRDHAQKSEINSDLKTRIHEALVTDTPEEGQEPLLPLVISGPIATQYETKNVGKANKQNILLTLDQPIQNALTDSESVWTIKSLIWEGNQPDAYLHPADSTNRTKKGTLIVQIRNPHNNQDCKQLSVTIEVHLDRPGPEITIQPVKPSILRRITSLIRWLKAPPPPLKTEAPVLPDEEKSIEPHYGVYS